MIDGAVLDATQILRNVEIACRQERAARNKKLIMAVEWAICHPSETIDPAQLRIAGGERPIQPGGDGTPKLAGFCVAEFGASMRVSIGSAERFIADALDLRYRLPQLWGRVRRNEIDGWQAQKIAQETRHLCLQQAALVDAAVADLVGRQAWSQTLRRLEGKIIEVDAARIADLAAAQAADKGVWIGEANEHGQKTIYARTDAPAVIWFDAMVARVADVLHQRGDQRSIDERRAAAIGILANPAYALRLLAEDIKPTLFDNELDPEPVSDPCAELVDAPGPWTGSGRGIDPDAAPRFPKVDHDLAAARALIDAIRDIDPAKLRPSATLYVHIAGETLRAAGNGVTRVEDVGPIVTSLVRDWLRDCHLTVRPVIDLNDTPPPADAYEIPARMREDLFLRQPTSVFPYAGSIGRQLDLDHTDPYRRDQHGQPASPGQTRIGNLGPFDRTAHRVVTHGSWQRRQPEPGTYLFRAPHGSIYLTNSSGTTDLGHDRFAQTIWHAAPPSELITANCNVAERSSV
jgi:hypothetical protein